MRRSILALTLVAGANAFAPALVPLKLRSSQVVNHASLKMVYGTPRSLSLSPPHSVFFFLWISRVLSLSLALSFSRSLSLSLARAFFLPASLIFPPPL